MSILDSNNIPYHINVSGNCFDNFFSLESYLYYNGSRMEEPETPWDDLKYNLIEETDM